MLSIALPKLRLLLGLAGFSVGAMSFAAADAPAHSSPLTVAARDPRIAYMGRVALDDAGAHLGFPGIVVRFVYRGPAPVLRFVAHSPNCYFNLACNGWDPVVLHLQEGVNEIPLPTGPAPESGWLVELTRRNEAWQGLATFAGLALPAGGELLAPPPWPARRMLFLGDSITCGEYIDCFPPGDETSATARMANAARAFGHLLGRQFGAQVHLVSYGGRGVVRDWQGKTDTGNAPQFFQRTLPDEPAAKWDHARYQPDVVVVCLGQNDFSSGLPDAAAYTAAYDRFVGEIRAAHPAAALVLAGSPMHSEAPDSGDRPKREQLYRTLETVAAKHRAAGARVAVVHVRNQPGTKLNAHPTAFQHEQIAADLAGPIRTMTGW